MSRLSSWHNIDMLTAHSKIATLNRIFLIASTVFCPQFPRIPPEFDSLADVTNLTGSEITYAINSGYQIIGAVMGSGVYIMVLTRLDYSWGRTCH